MFLPVTRCTGCHRDHGMLPCMVCYHACMLDGCKRHNVQVQDDVDRHARAGARRSSTSWAPPRSPSTQCCMRSQSRRSRWTRRSTKCACSVAVLLLAGALFTTLLGCALRSCPSGDWRNVDCSCTVRARVPPQRTCSRTSASNSSLRSVHSCRRYLPTSGTEESFATTRAATECYLVPKHVQDRNGLEMQHWCLRQLTASTLCAG